MTTFLRFPDEATAQTALADFYDASYGWQTASLVHALDPIGTLYDEADPPAPIAGWHLNFIGDLPEAAQAYVLTPVSPRVVFAGTS